MARKLPPIGTQLSSRRAMLETLVRNLHMVQLSAAVAMVAGCTGLVDNHAGADSPALAAAKEAWTSEALPALTAGTCVGCHASQAGEEFLKGPDVRATLLGFSPQAVNLDAPGSSRVLTKGAHSGPALSGDEVTSILDWIKLEKDAASDPGVDEPDLEIAPFVPTLCPMGTDDDACPTNDLDLGGLGLTGAKLHFTAEALPSASTSRT
jgi:mono/diheme cytochrome c family protein